jgi:hypothetical protein
LLKKMEKVLVEAKWIQMLHHEMRLIMAKVLYTFDFELGPESEG